MYAATELYLHPNLAHCATITTSAKKSGDADVIADGKISKAFWVPAHPEPGEDAYVQMEWDKMMDIEKIVLYLSAANNSNKFYKNHKDLIDVQYWNGTKWVSFGVKINDKNTQSIVDKTIVYHATYDEAENPNPVQDRDYYQHSGSAGMAQCTLELPTKIFTEEIRFVPLNYSDCPDDDLGITELEVYGTEKPVNIALATDDDSPDKAYYVSENAQIGPTTKVDVIFDGDRSTGCGSNASSDLVHMCAYWKKIQPIKDLCIIRTDIIDYWIEISTDTTNGNNGNWSRLEMVV